MDFLAAHDSQTAQRAVATILAAFERLTMPTTGAPVADRPGLRKLIIDFGSSGYGALYRCSPKTDTLRVLTMKHQEENAYK